MPISTPREYQNYLDRSVPPKYINYNEILNSRFLVHSSQNMIQSSSARAQYLSARPPSMSSTISPMAGFINQSINMRNYFDTFVERQWYLSSASPMATVQNHYLSRNERRAFGYALRRRYLHHKQPRKKHRHPYTFRRKKRHQ